MWSLGCVSLLWLSALLSWEGVPSDCDLDNCRQRYHETCLDFRNQILVEGFLSDMRQIETMCPNDARIQGYLAAAGMIHAGLGWNPIEAWQQFNEWKPKLEEAIAQLPEDPDLRLLRLGVQSNAPSLLSYHGNIEEDLDQIRSALQAGYWRNNLAFEAFVQKTVTTFAP